MAETVIRADKIGKYYRLGILGGGTLREDLNRWWALARGRPDPSIPVGTEASSLVKRKKIWALRDVSFDVGDGEILGIIGRNGAGKSTLLKILSRITAPTSGGAVITGRVGSLLEVGTGFHPELTGRENTFLNGAILGMKKKEVSRKFEEIVSFAEIEDYIDTPVKRYSSGMYVRLAFAVAAHLEPEILIVDEVLAVGDVAFQQKCLGKMGEVSKGGRTILFVSHNMSAIAGLCNRVILMDSGMVKGNGPPADVIEKYLEGMTAHFREEDKESDLMIRGISLKNSRGEDTSSFRSNEDICVEIEYDASKKIEKPHFWVSVESQFGSVFAANMLIDGLQPDSIHGRGKISVLFSRVRLMPQTYYLSMGCRDRKGVNSLAKTKKSVVSFSVVDSARNMGMKGEIAGRLLSKASPVLVDYEWRYEDGTRARPSWAGRNS